jgi:hypothetical protein
MQRNNLITLIIFIAILFVPGSLIARTRNDFLIDSDHYIDKTWICQRKNLFDNYRNIDLLPIDIDFKMGNHRSLPINPDGRDDRRGNPETDMRWPYIENKFCTGIAYAFGKIDSPLEFDSHINTLSSRNYIAGARQADTKDGCFPDQTRYEDYAGIDCSGFVMRLVGGSDISAAAWNNSNKWNVADYIRYYCVEKNPRDLAAGDVLVYLGPNNGNHVVVFGGGTPGSVIEIRHAVPVAYSTGVHERKVLKENVSSRIVNNGLNIPVKNKLGNISDKFHQSLTPFPLYTSVYPENTVQISASAPQSIPVKVYIASRLGFSLIKMKLDGNDITDKIQVSSYVCVNELKYVPNPVLEDGTHTVEVTVENMYHLEDKKSFQFRLEAARDSDGDGLPDDWEIENGLDPYNPNDALRDDDGDGLSNLEEYMNGTNPKEKNTDKSVKKAEDGDELHRGTNPLDEKDDDGYKAPVEKPGDRDLPHRGRDYSYESSDEYQQEILIAKDPNMMTGPEGQVSPGQMLNYTVEFENVGEGIVYGVYVMDKLNENIDDSTILISNCKRIDYAASSAEVPAHFEYRYNKDARTVTVFIDNEGEVEPKQGGKFDITVKLKDNAAKGTVVTNYATVCFASVPEITNTNTVVSVVPTNTSINYRGQEVVEYSDSIELSACLHDLLGKSISGHAVNFVVNGSSFSMITANGIASNVINDNDILPGEYQTEIRYDGDGYYFLPSSLANTLKIEKKGTVLSAPFLETVYSATNTIEVSLMSNSTTELFHQQDEPKVVYLDYLVDDTWLTLAQTTLIKSSATFEVSLPTKPAKLSYPLRARFNGDSRYRESTAEGKLNIVDAIPPSIAISSPVAGAQYAVGASSIPVHFMVDDLDPAPTVYAFLTDLQKGTTISVSNGEYIDPLALDSGFWSLTVEATDWAGNSSSATVDGFEVVHDTQAPVICISSPKEGDRYISGLSTITVQYQITDTVSVNPAVVSYFTSIVDGTTLQVSNGQTIDPSALTTGYWWLSVEAVDSAHNTASAVTGNFEVIHDLLPPVSKLVLSTPTYLTDGRTYVAPETAFTLSVADNLVIPGDGSGTGVQASYYAIDSSSYSLRTGTFTVSQEGEHSVYFYSTDLAGNRETPKTFKVFVDTTAPSTAITVTGPSADSSGKTVITGKTLFALAATDNGCGVSSSEYQIDDSSWTTYMLPFGIALPDGMHTVSYCSTDNLNIRGVAGTLAVIIDNTPPVISITQGISPTNISTRTITGMYDDTNISTITVNGAAASIDVSNRTYSATLILREGNNAIDVEALDLVGNIAVSTANIVLDTVPPVLHAPDDLLVEATGDETSVFIGSATAVDSFPVTITNDAPASYRLGTTSVTWTATDTAGNCSLSVQRVTVVDPTPPDVMVRISTPVYNSGSSVFINCSTDMELALAKAGFWIDRIMYTVNGIPHVYSAPFQLTAEGNYTIVCYAVNKYERTGPEKSFTVTVDTTPPQSNFRLSDAGCQTLLNGVLFVNGAANFILESIDPVSGGVCSGVRQMRCQIDNSEFRAISAGSVSIDLSSLPDGQHTINYYGIDNVDNSENVKSYTFVFDRTKPAVLSTFPQNNSRIRAKDIPSIKIVFSEPVRTASWADAVVVKEAKDRIIKDFAIAYDSSACTLTITGALKNNTVYTVTLLNTVTDRVSNKLDEFTFSFTTYLSAKEGGIVQNDNLGLTITAVPDALLCDGYFETNIIDGVTLPDLVNPLQWVLGDGKAYEIIFKDTGNNIVSEPLVQPIEIALAQQSGTLSLAPGKEESESLTNLRLYQIWTANDVKKAQYRVPTRRSLAGMPVQKLESAKGQPLTCRLTSLGLFSMAGLLAPGSSLGDLSCYPSPFNPNREMATIQYYLINASDVGIAVYDLLGNLVKTWKISAGDNGAQAGLNQLSWDGRNGAGDVIANGGYIVSVHADRQNRKFKVLVVK